MRQVGVGELLVLDALLDVLVVEVELLDAVVGAEADVVVGDDGPESLLLGLGFVPVVFLFLRQVFLNLFDVGADVRWRREDGRDVQRGVVRVDLLPLGLGGPEEAVVLDGVVDAGGGEQRVEPPAAGGGGVLGEDCIDGGPLRQWLAGLDALPFGS